MDGLYNGFKILWSMITALWQIPDFRETVILSLITAAVGIFMRKMDCSAKEIATVCIVIELIVVLSALFVI